MASWTAACYLYACLSVVIFFVYEVCEPVRDAPPPLSVMALTNDYQRCVESCVVDFFNFVSTSGIPFGTLL
jgi:hypothetical protein